MSHCLLTSYSVPDQTEFLLLLAPTATSYSGSKMFAQPARQASSRFRSQSQRSASSVSSSGGSDGSSLESPDAAAPFQDSQQQQQQLTAPIHNGQGIFLQSQSISRSDDGFELVSSSSANRHASAVSATSSPSISVSSAREPLSPILTSDVSLSEPSAVSLPRTHFKAIRRRASEVHDLDLFKDTLAHSTSTTTKPSTRDVVDDDLSHSIHALSAGLNPSIRPRHSYRTISHSRGRQRNKRRSATAIQSDASSNKRSCQSLSPASHPASLHPVNRSTASATARGPTSTRKQSQHSQLRHKSALQSLLRIDSETCALLATQPAGRCVASLTTHLLRLLLTLVWIQHPRRPFVES